MDGEQIERGSDPGHESASTEPSTEVDGETKAHSKDATPLDASTEPSTEVDGELAWDLKV